MAHHAPQIEQCIWNMARLFEVNIIHSDHRHTRHTLPAWKNVSTPATPITHDSIWSELMNHFIIPHAGCCTILHVL